MLIKFYKFWDNLIHSPAKKNKFLLISSIVAFLLNIGLWFFLYFQMKRILNLQPQITTIPLHYNVFLGIDSFGKWYKAFILPTIGSVVLILNVILSMVLYSKKVLASYFLTVTSLLVQIFLAISGVLIILINLK